MGAKKTLHSSLKAEEKEPEAPDNEATTAGGYNRWKFFKLCFLLGICVRKCLQITSWPPGSILTDFQTGRMLGITKCLGGRQQGEVGENRRTREGRTEKKAGEEMEKVEEEEEEEEGWVETNVLPLQMGRDEYKEVEVSWKFQQRSSCTFFIAGEPERFLQRQSRLSGGDPEDVSITLNSNNSEQ